MNFSKRKFQPKNIGNYFRLNLIRPVPNTKAPFIWDRPFLAESYASGESERGYLRTEKEPSELVQLKLNIESSVGESTQCHQAPVPIICI